MNSTRIAVCLVSGLALLTIAVPQRARAQFSQSFSLDITQRGEPGGGVSYGLQIVPLPFRTTLIAPDGTVLGTPPPGIPAFGVNGLTFAELATRFFGTWTIRDTIFSPPNPVSEHSFTFSPFAPNDLFSETPIITTPADLSVVPTSFALEWAYPSGAMPNSRLVSHSITSGDGSVTFAPNREQRVQFAVDLEGQGPATLTVRAGTTVNIPSQISPVILNSGPGRTMYTVGAQFRILSEPVRLTVVPEPHSLWIAAGAACILWAACSRSCPLVELRRESCYKRQRLHSFLLFRHEVAT